MSESNMQLSYRSSAIEGASPIGLVIALYDRLVADLRRAADALRADDIEGRCLQLNHAGFVLGQLQDWVNLKSGEPLAQNLFDFYAQLRAKMLQASISKSASLLDEQIELILQVRTAWQQRDSSSPVGAEVLPNVNIATAALQVPERIAFSQSA